MNKYIKYTLWTGSIVLLLLVVWHIYVVNNPQMTYVEEQVPISLKDLALETRGLQGCELIQLDLSSNKQYYSMLMKCPYDVVLDIESYK